MAALIPLWYIWFERERETPYCYPMVTSWLDFLPPPRLPTTTVTTTTSNTVNDRSAAGPPDATLPNWLPAYTIIVLFMASSSSVFFGVVVVVVLTNMHIRSGVYKTQIEKRADSGDRWWRKVDLSHNTRKVQSSSSFLSYLSLVGFLFLLEFWS